MTDKLSSLNYKKQNIIHMRVSLCHDHVPAQQLGIATCWVNRGGSRHGTFAAPRIEKNITPKYAVKTLNEFINYYY